MATATAATTATRAEARLWGILQIVSAAATAAPLLFVRYLPFTDLPEHVAAIATVSRMLPGGGGAPEYALSLGASQYILYDLVGALLSRIGGDPVAANRWLLVAVAFAWPYAFRALLRALHRDERLAIFSGMLFWNRALLIGFLPFVASVPFAVFALATLVRQIDAPTPSRSRGALLAIASLLLFYTHVSTYVLLVGAGAVMTAYRLRSHSRRARRALVVLAPLLPSAACALMWWSAGSLAASQGERAHVQHLPLSVALDAAPVWAFDIWRSHADELWSSLWWLGFGLLTVTALRRRPTPAELREGLFAGTPFLCTLVLYLVTPFHVGPAGYLDVRLAPLLGLFALLLLRPVGRATPWLIALGAIATAGTGATAAIEMRTVERERLGDFDALLAQARPGTRLAMVNFDQRSPRTYFFPYIFAGSYHRLKPGTVAGYSFTELAHWPIHYAPGAAPPVHAVWWQFKPCEFRYRADGEYYDYVLVQGSFDPFREDHPGPEFHEIARAGVFVLYEKDRAAPADDDGPDRGPCRPRPPPPPP